MKDLKNCKYLSFLEYVGERGDILSNMLILSEKQHLEKQVEKNDLDNNVAIAVSNSSYSNYKISFDQLKHFDQHTQKKPKGAQHMLIMDGVESYMHSEFI